MNAELNYRNATEISLHRVHLISVSLKVGQGNKTPTSDMVEAGYPTALATHVFSASRSETLPLPRNTRIKLSDMAN